MLVIAIMVSVTVWYLEGIFIDESFWTACVEGE